jgi:hypothetical protein
MRATCPPQKIIHTSLKLCVAFDNMIVSFYVEGLFAPCQISKMKYYPLSVVRDCLFSSICSYASSCIHNRSIEVTISLGSHQVSLQGMYLETIKSCATRKIISLHSRREDRQTDIIVLHEYFCPLSAGVSTLFIQL